MIANETFKVANEAMSCPIWGETTDPVRFSYTKQINGFPYSPLIYSPRAGGIYQAGPTNRILVSILEYLHTLTPRERANLSYRIYKHNWNMGLLRPRSPRNRQDVCLAILSDPAPLEGILQVTQEIGINGLLNQPPAEERLLSFVREWLWQQDHGQSNLPFLYAASACVTEIDYAEFTDALRHYQWLRADTNPQHIFPNLAARLWVEQQERAQGSGKQGFVAMWFDEDLRSAYEHGFKQAIKAAGYDPRRIDDDPNHSDNLVDRILAEIRQSRFVVADFTCGMEENRQGNKIYLDRGGIYYEAGFAYGQGIPVIYTCRQDLVDKLHFDIRQLNHLLWKDEQDLARKLQARIESQFGRGPVVPQTKSEKNVP